MCWGRYGMLWGGWHMLSSQIGTPGALAVHVAAVVVVVLVVYKLVRARLGST